MYRYENLLETLVKQVESDGPHQVVDPGRADFGAVIWPEHGFPCTDHTTGGVSLARMIAAYLLDGSSLRRDPALLERVLGAIKFFSAWQRSTGLIDLPTVDFDSPPDTAFFVQLLCPVLNLARHHAVDDPEGAGAIAIALEGPLLRAARGIVGRGFRTPNHRWVVCSALAQAMTLFPSLDARAYVDSILAETIDINSDGEYSERSTGIYSAVCNRALILVARHHRRPELLDAVRANLVFMSTMINPDGSVDTTVSRRQDHGADVVPVSMTDSFHEMSVLDKNPIFSRISQRLAAHALTQPVRGADSSIFWMLHSFFADPNRVPEVSAPVVSTPAVAQREQFLTDSRLWRYSSPACSATAAAGTVSPFSLTCGNVMLKSFRVRGTYFHGARFVPRQIETMPGGGVRLVHRADPKNPPGWDLPLGRPVLFDDPHTGYYHLADDGTRQRWLLPPLDMMLTITPDTADGFDLHLRTVGGVDRVPFIVEFFFTVGGKLRTDCMTARPGVGDLVELTKGHATYHTGTHAIQVGPGSDTPSMVSRIESAPVSGCFRLVVPLVSPIDRHLTVRCGLWSEATRSILPPSRPPMRQLPARVTPVFANAV